MGRKRIIFQILDRLYHYSFSITFLWRFSLSSWNTQGVVMYLFMLSYKECSITFSIVVWLLPKLRKWEMGRAADSESWADRLLVGSPLSGLVERLSQRLILKYDEVSHFELFIYSISNYKSDTLIFGLQNDILYTEYQFHYLFIICLVC